VPANTFSIGRDCSLVVMAPTGRIDLTYVTAFESHQLTVPVRVDCIDGVALGAELPKGWDGSFELERGDSTVDDFIASMEASFINGQNLGAGTLYQYVAEPDGSTSTYQYSNVVFKLTHAGTWRGDASVKQRLEFFASQRLRV
jgi:hypothetical protein